MLNRYAGFTIIELMITLVILAVVTTIVAPGLGNIIEGNRLATSTNLVVSSIRLARSEALKRGETVTFSTDGGMGSGWCVHRGGPAINCNQQANLIRRFQAPGGLIFNANNNDYTFDRQGFLTPEPDPNDPPNLITLMPNDCPAGEQSLRAINISPVGRTDITNGVCP